MGVPGQEGKHQMLLITDICRYPPWIQCFHLRQQVLNLVSVAYQHFHWKSFLAAVEASLICFVVATHLAIVDGTMIIHLANYLNSSVRSYVNTKTSKLELTQRLLIC